MVHLNKQFYKELKLILLALFLLTLTSLIIWAFSKQEVGRFHSPDGNYECVLTRPNYLSLLSASPGQSGDLKCNLSIYDHNGKHLGTCPLPYTSLAYSGLVWTNDGMYVKIRPGPEWNFKDDTCTYHKGSDQQLVSGL